ncbi:hypothetical protein TL16_g01328 [Triparma laevis f. inornata]|uniref:Uncharacterized protein n=1 Tax=Triparma laevis f. inornata TaxID=1714386 RepID=A0A9W7DRU7_9STRA|nr:hypothetical protein TL16_g01328 [Triparma laevis f. inornata]
MSTLHTSHRPQGRIICVLEVFHSQAKKARLEVFADTNPRALSEEFAGKHGLSDKYKKALERHIEENMREKEGSAGTLGTRQSLSPTSTIATNTVENVKQGGALFPSDDQDPFSTNNIPRSTPDSANALGMVGLSSSTSSDDGNSSSGVVNEQHSKMWADLKNHWATPVGVAPPKLHTSHPSVPSKLRSTSITSNGSSSYDSATGKKKKKKKKKKVGEIGKKAKKISSRLYEHASSIKKRHDDMREIHQNAELEYCSSNQFSTSKKTKQMAGRRSMFMISSYSPEQMHEMAVMTGGQGDGQSQSGDLNDFGNRLHLEAGMKLQRRKKVMEEKLKKEKEQELEGCTFKPVLSEGTEALKKTKKREKNVFEELHDKQEEVSEKKAYYEQIAFVNKDCTFKPEINDHSEVLQMLSGMEEGTGEIDTRPKFEKLYEERNKRAEKVEEIKNSLPTDEADECTFKPDIGANAHRAKPDKNSTEFINRLYNEHETILKKKEERVKQVQEAWFKPEIGRSPLNARNVENLPIHEHLSELTKKSLEAKKVKVEGREAQDKESRMFKANPKSQKMLANMKKQSCEELFRVLLATIEFKKQGNKASVDDSIAELVGRMQDEEEGGLGGGGDWREKLLDATKCDPNLLDDNVAKIVKPLLARHQGSPMTLDLFVDLTVIELERVGVEALDVVRTMRNRQREQRAIALKANVEEEKGGFKGPIKRLKGIAKFKAVASAVKQFHPSINKNSKRIANSQSRRGKGELLFTSLHAAQKMLEVRRETLRKQKIKEEDDECTFKPEFFAKTYKGKGNYPIKG